MRYKLPDLDFYSTVVTKGVFTLSWSFRMGTASRMGMTYAAELIRPEVNTGA